MTQRCSLIISDSTATSLQRSPPSTRFRRPISFFDHFARGLCVLLPLLAAPTPASAFDVDSYRELAMASVRQLSTGVAGDIDELMAIQEQLMVLGLEGGVEYLLENPENGEPLQLAILNAEQMKSMTLVTLVDQWQNGRFLAKKGLNQEALDHFGPIKSLMDSIIQPAFAYLCVKEYKRTGDSELLANARTKLLEISERITLFAPEDVQTAQSQ